MPRELRFPNFTRMNFDGGMKRETPAGCLVRYYDYEAPASGTSKLHFPRQPGDESRALLRGTDLR